MAAKSAQPSRLNDNDVTCIQRSKVILDIGSMPRNIIIVGVPRSGTSLTTAVFASKGYHVGWIKDDKTRLGDERNPFGYFEADDVIEKNVEIFRQVGYQEHNTWLREMITDRAIARIAEVTPSEEHRVFVESYQSRAPWVWKDPRLCLTLPYWWKLFDPATTGVVLMKRDISEIFRSFRVMGWYSTRRADRDQALFRIERHLRAARESIETLRIPHIEIDYKEYFSAPHAVARRLSEFAGLEISAEDLNVRQDLTHSTLRGRVLAWLRTALDSGPLRHTMVLRPFIPDSVLRLIFPEKKYVRSK